MLMSANFNTNEILRAYDIRPSKGLGQNFLNDITVVQDIVFTAELSKEDAVIEIGPGLGVMTEILAEQAGLVVAVEIDERLIKVLTPLSIRMGNIEIINRDIMKIDINKEIIDKIIAPRGFKSVKVVANLPYYITTPIIMKLLEENVTGLEKMVFMVQKEVAERMVAPPGGKDYGAMTVSVNYFSEGKIAFIVPPHCFTPRPGVDSAVVSLDIRKEPPFELIDKDYFFKIVKASFAQRRKMLVNGLINAPYTRTTREKVLAALEKMGKDEKVRGETLSAEEFGMLANLLISEN